MGVVPEALQGVVYLAGDETVTEHPGRKVFGKGRHRDAKRSSHSFVAHLWGHKWVVLAILVKRTKKRKRLTVNWYGGQSRRVEVVTGTGHWYKSGEGLVEVLWVFVHDLTGTYRDEDFFTTDVTWSARQVIETFTGRWSIEVTFQEVRAYLGVETTRGWIERTVLRAEPCLFCLYSVVALWYAALPERDRQKLEPTWTGKTTVTFSDAITLVRRDLWSRWIFAAPAFKLVMQKLTPNQKRQLTRTLTLAT